MVDRPTIYLLCMIYMVSKDRVFLMFNYFTKSQFFIIVFFLLILGEKEASGAALRGSETANNFTKAVLVNNIKAGEIFMEEKPSQFSGMGLIRTGLSGEFLIDDFSALDSFLPQKTELNNVTEQNFITDGVPAHLNWFQVVKETNSRVFEPIDVFPITSDTVLTPIFPPFPFIDPISGGFLTSWADAIPWYFDLYTVDEEEVPYASQSVNDNFKLSSKYDIADRAVLSYTDFPVGPKETKFEFDTFLVADYGNKTQTYDVLDGFSWSFEVIEETQVDDQFFLQTEVTSLNAGTSFDPNYESLIQNEFPGYRRIENSSDESLPTIVVGSSGGGGTEERLRMHLGYCEPEVHGSDCTEQKYWAVDRPDFYEEYPSSTDQTVQN